MKIKNNFVLRQIVDMWIVLPVDTAAVDFDGMLTLNESGVLLWNALTENCNRQDLANILTSEYNVSTETALADVDEFIERLRSVGCLEMP